MNTNAALIFNLETNQSELYRIGDEGSRFVSISYDGQDIWLIPRAHGSLIRWNLEKNTQHIMNQYPIGFENRIYSLYRSVYLDGYLWVFRHMGNMNIKIDVHTGEMTEFHLPYDDEEIPGCRYPIINIENGKIRIHPGEHYEWIELDTKTNEIEKFTFQKSEKCKALELKYFFEEKSKKGYLLEQDNCKLVDFINICLLDDEHKSDHYESDCGMKIHEFIIKDLENDL
jgi:desulfoferrodoxin (superoxide reductase-like protein)